LKNLSNFSANTAEQRAYGGWRLPSNGLHLPLEDA
jgi:hypothetical protein